MVGWLVGLFPLVSLSLSLPLHVPFFWCCCAGFGPSASMIDMKVWSKTVLTSLEKGSFSFGSDWIDPISHFLHQAPPPHLDGLRSWLSPRAHFGCFRGTCHMPMRRNTPKGHQSSLIPLELPQMRHAHHSTLMLIQMLLYLIKYHIEAFPFRLWKQWAGQEAEALEAKRHFSCFIDLILSTFEYCSQNENLWKTRNYDEGQNMN